MASQEPEQTIDLSDRTRFPKRASTWLWIAGLLALLAVGLSAPGLVRRASVNAGMLTALRAATGGTLAPHDLASAERRLERALTQDSYGSRDAHVGLAILSEARGRYDNAAEHWLAAGYDGAQLADTASELFRARQYAVAANWAERATRVDPHAVGNWKLLAACYARLERWESALDAARRAREQLASTTPGYSDLLAWLGLICGQRLATPDPECALEALNAAIAADRFLDEPARIGALATRADVLYRAGHVTEAIANYEQIVALDPQRYWVLVQLGTLYWTDQNDAAAGEASWARAIALRPGHKEAYFRLASLYRQTDRPALAIELYDRILAIDPGDTRARNALQNLRNAEDAS